MTTKTLLRHGAATVVLLSAAIASEALAAPPSPIAPDHIFYIMMENHGYDELIGNDQAPFINALAKKYALATNYYGVTHPSEPNYLAAVSGSTQGIFDDCAAVVSIPGNTPSTCTPEEFWPADIVQAKGANDATDADPMTDAQYQAASLVPHVFQGETIVDQLTLSGRSWKAYMQGLSASPMLSGGLITNETVYEPNYPAGPTGPQVKLYAQKHNPFMYFANTRASQAQLSKIVPFNQFQTDLNSGKVPAFSFIVPDQCSDMHGVSTSATDWLTANGYPQYAGCDVDFSGAGTPPAPNVVTIGDAFLNQWVTAIRNSPAWKSGHNYIIITWDEDDYSGFSGCCGSPTNSATWAVLGGAHVPAIVISNGPQPLHIDSLPGNHYTMLGAIQALWDLPCLGNTCNLYNRTAMLPLFY
jgi:hypothetical protein